MGSSHAPLQWLHKSFVALIVCQKRKSVADLEEIPENPLVSPFLPKEPTLLN